MVTFEMILYNLEKDLLCRVSDSIYQFKNILTLVLTWHPYDKQWGTKCDLILTCSPS